MGETIIFSANTSQAAHKTKNAIRALLKETPSDAGHGNIMKIGNSRSLEYFVRLAQRDIKEIYSPVRRNEKPKIKLKIGLINVISTFL